MKLSRTLTSLFIAGALSAFVLGSCKKDKPEDEVTPEDSYDKAAMLANIGNNLIVPAFVSFRADIDSLQTLAVEFSTTADLTNLAALRDQFIRVYQQWQHCAVFQFGPAENEYMRSAFNTFPCDTTHINNKIAAGEFTLGAASDLDVKGLPALDFLLNRVDGNDNLVLARFTTSPYAANAKTYLLTLISEMKTKADNATNGWIATGGNYNSTFVSSTGSSIGSSIGLMVNDLNYDLEILKNAKVGIPLGKKTLGVAQPTKVEALYSSLSLSLADESLRSIEDAYLGRSRAGVNGKGFDDYLVHIGATYAGGSLNDAICNKFASAKAKLAMISGPLSDAVVTSPAVVDAAYIELQQLVILLKVDMPSALGVAITYVDNDGD